jgi:hypothetical protein
LQSWSDLEYLFSLLDKEITGMHVLVIQIEFVSTMLIICSTLLVLRVVPPNCMSFSVISTKKLDKQIVESFMILFRVSVSLTISCIFFFVIYSRCD